MAVQNGVVRRVEHETSVGYGVRALFEGSWGFSASDAFDDASLDAAAARARRRSRRRALAFRAGFAR